MVIVSVVGELVVGTRRVVGVIRVLRCQGRFICIPCPSERRELGNVDLRLRGLEAVVNSLPHTRFVTVG